MLFCSFSHICVYGCFFFSIFFPFFFRSHSPWRIDGFKWVKESRLHQHIKSLRLQITVKLCIFTFCLVFSFSIFALWPEQMKSGTWLDKWSSHSSGMSFSLISTHLVRFSPSFCLFFFVLYFWPSSPCVCLCAFHYLGPPHAVKCDTILRLVSTYTSIWWKHSLYLCADRLVGWMRDIWSSVFYYTLPDPQLLFHHNVWLSHQKFLRPKISIVRWKRISTHNYPHAFVFVCVWARFSQSNCG